MNDKTLLIFLQKILANGSHSKASVSIGQLVEILKSQNADDQLISIAEKALASIPEAAELAKKNNSLSSNDLEIAAKRAEERKKREQAMRSYGRC